MSIDGIHWAQKVHGPTMCPYRKALLFALGERHNIDSGMCFPDQEMLARDAAMSVRTVRKYAQILEEEGFIERKITSVGAGVRTHYILYFDRLQARSVATIRNGGAESDRHNLPKGPIGTPVPHPFGTPVPDPFGTCVPVHKKHESNTNKNTNTSGSTSKRKVSKADDSEILKAFEAIWSLWPSKGRERSRSRSMVLDQLRRSAKIRPVSEILAAARTFVAKTEERYVPGLDRWLQQGRFENFLPKDLAERAGATTPSTEVGQGAGGIDWTAAVARYVRSRIWPRSQGPRPDEIGYRGTLAAIEAVFATGRFGMADQVGLKINLDRLRAEQTA